MLTQHQHTSSAVALALPSSAHSMHTLWHDALLKTYSVMCVGEAAHMHVVGSVINLFFFLHTRVSMIAITREGKRRLRGIYVGGGFLTCGHACVCAKTPGQSAGT